MCILLLLPIIDVSVVLLLLLSRLVDSSSVSIVVFVFIIISLDDDDEFLLMFDNRMDEFDWHSSPLNLTTKTITTTTIITTIITTTHFDCESSLNSIVNDDCESLLANGRNGGNSGLNERGMDDNGIELLVFTSDEDEERGCDNDDDGRERGLEEEPSSIFNLHV